MKFLIKKINRREKSIKGTPVFGTGEDYLSIYEDTLDTVKIGENKFKFRTGLNENDIKTSPVLTSELKEVYLNNLDLAKEKIKSVYGEEALDNTNKIFWKSLGKLVINNEMLTTVLDDEKDVKNLILRYNIAGGGYSDIAPSFETALATSRKYYIIDQVDFNNESFEENVSTKLKATSLLHNLYEKGSFEALLYLSWLVLPNTQGFTKNNSKEVLVSVLSDFIDGKLVNKDKKACAKLFIDYANMWKNDKENLIIEALFNIAVYFGYIILVEGRYTTKNRSTVLGANKQMSIKALKDVKNIDELKELKDTVDERLSK